MPKNQIQSKVKEHLLAMSCWADQVVKNSLKEQYQFSAPKNSPMLMGILLLKNTGKILSGVLKLYIRRCRFFLHYQQIFFDKKTYRFDFLHEKQFGALFASLKMRGCEHPGKRVLIMLRDIRRSVFTVGAFILGFSGQVSAALVLPDVSPCADQSLSGGLNNLQCITGTQTYVASYHDEFLSYSIEALEVIQDKSNILPVDVYGDWSKLVAGSGQLDVGVLIKVNENGAGVLNNDPPFPDAEASNTNDTVYVRTWGGDEGTDTKQGNNDPGGDTILTVQEVVDWLSPQSIPVFYFDLADPQNDPNADLYFSGQVYITDSTGTTVLDTWAFDNTFDGEYQDTNPVLAPKNVPVYIAGSGCDFDKDASNGIDDICIITNSRGSGSPEFIAYAPGIDLSSYANGTDTDANLFWGNFRIESSEGANEEIYLTKRVSTQVPEPATAILLAGGLLGISFARRKLK